MPLPLKKATEKNQEKLKPKARHPIQLDSFYFNSIINWVLGVCQWRKSKKKIEIFKKLLGFMQDFESNHFGAFSSFFLLPGLVLNIHSTCCDAGNLLNIVQILSSE